MPSEKNWFLLARAMGSGELGATALLNLNCVQTVEIVSDTSIRLRFSETQTISVEGHVALDLVKHLMTKVICFDQELKA